MKGLKEDIKSPLHRALLVKMLKDVYNSLLQRYSYQGWWPLIENQKVTYHPKDYSYPKNKEQEFEICAGVILTQNTSWKNAGRALLSLHNNGMLNPKDIIENSISNLIKSSGYYNQKTRKLKEFSKFFISEFDKLKKMKIEDARNLLLSINGIGKESADSILLYALKKPIFVVDAYTKRLFSSISPDYDKLQEYFHKNLKNDYRIFNEFHALIVQAGKDNLKID